MAHPPATDADESPPQGEAARKLAERVKELTVLAKAAELVQRTPPNSSLLPKQLADLLPRGFQYPEDCVARVRIGDREAHSRGYRPGAATLRVPISEGSKIGELEVAYLHDHGATGSNAFLPEEPVLLQSVADLVRMALRQEEAEHKLRAREAMFRALAENSPDFIARYDCDRRCLYASPSLARLAGVLPETLIGHRPSDGPMPPDVGRRMDAAIQEVFETGQPLRFEVMAEMSAGQLHLDMHYYPETDRSGQVAAVLEIGRDITPLRQALDRVEEERGRLVDLLDSLGDAFFSAAPDPEAPSGIRVLVASQGVERMFGVTRSQLEADPWCFLAAIHPDDQPKIKAGAQRLGADTDRPLVLNYRVMNPAGRERWVRGVYIAVKDGGDHLVRIDGHTRDITTEVEAQGLERSLASSEQQVLHLQEMNDFRARFLNMAAHELNTPLTPLGLEMNLLRNEKLGPLTDRQRHAVAMLDRNVKRLKILVQDMLDAGRLQSGRLRIEPVETDLADVVRDVADLFRESARDSGVRIVVRIKGDLPVVADGRRMEQIVVNLISNAVKYSPDGGQVTVTGRSENGQVRIQVKDQGMGLTAEQISRLFQPFTQVHDGSRVRGGTGLGLYISKGIVDAHDGTIGVESAGPGKGSMFWFTLPRDGPVRVADEEDMAPPRGSGVGGASD